MIPIPGNSGVELAPYPSSRNVATGLVAIADAERSHDELLLLDSLAGFVARDSPQLYRVSNVTWRNDSSSDSYAAWLLDLESTHDVAVDETMLTAPADNIVALFLDQLVGGAYVTCNATNGSVSAALTLAAASDTALLIASNDNLAASLSALGLKLAVDATPLTIDDVLTDALPNLSNRVIMFQEPVNSDLLGDYSIFARAASMSWSGGDASRATLMSHAYASGSVGAAFGWGPENDYVSILNSYGMMVHASDFNKNLAALANVAVESKAATDSSVHDATPRRDNNNNSAVHTVAFVMTDGDNLQWTLGPWSTSETWFGSPQRGKVPMGWTWSAGSSFVAPSVVGAVQARLSANDELVSGPSGAGYVYPSTWPTSLKDDFITLASHGDNVAAMRVVNVLAGDEAGPQLEHIEGAFAAQKDCDAVLYYSYGSGYSGFYGALWFNATGTSTMSSSSSIVNKQGGASGKAAVLSGRRSLWGNDTDTSSPMLGVDAMIELLLSLPQNASSPDGYSLIPVMAWTHSYADVVTIADALAAAGGFDVVLPSELARRINENLGDSPTCTCSTPNAGATAGQNKYVCTDGTVGFCSASDTCYAALPFLKGDWNSGCRAE